MAVSQLTTTSSSSGTQATTQTPQAATGTSTGTQASRVQQGTAATLLTSQNGVPLQNTPVSTVSLVTRTTASTTAQPQPAVKHQVNVPLLGVSIIFCVIAAILFGITNRSAKNTTI